MLFQAFSTVGIYSDAAVPSVNINNCYKLNLFPMQYKPTLPSPSAMVYLKQ